MLFFLPIHIHNPYVLLSLQLFQVSFKANLEGVAELGLNIDEGFDLMVKCTKCNEERGPVHLDPVRILRSLKDV